MLVNVSSMLSGMLSDIGWPPNISYHSFRPSVQSASLVHGRSSMLSRSPACSSLA